MRKPGKSLRHPAGEEETHGPGGRPAGRKPILCAWPCLALGASLQTTQPARTQIAQRTEASKLESPSGCNTRHFRPSSQNVFSLSSSRRSFLTKRRKFVIFACRNYTSPGLRWANGLAAASKTLTPSPHGNCLGSRPTRQVLHLKNFRKVVCAGRQPAGLWVSHSSWTFSGVISQGLEDSLSA